MSVLRTGRESEGIINMVGEDTQALGELSLRKEEGEIASFISGRVTINFYSPLYRA